ncbi:unnamed protein product, partial [Acanthoscelides obtectus]
MLRIFISEQRCVKLIYTILSTINK